MMGENQSSKFENENESNSNSPLSGELKSFSFRFVRLPGFDSKYAKSLIREMQVIKELEETLRPPSSVFEIGEDDTLVLEGRGVRGKVAHPAWRVRVSSESGTFHYASEEYQCSGGDCGH